MNKIVKFIRDNYITFTVYAVIGWIYEVTWLLVMGRGFENRGVLFGPYLPIYGFGMLILLLILKKYKSNKHKLSDSVNGLIATWAFTTFIFITVIEYTTSPKILSVTEFFKRFWIPYIIAIGLSLVLRYILVNKTKLKNMNITWINVCLIIFIVTTLIEYASHYVIDTYFGKILWDYKDDFLNINARVNFDASRNFALGGAALLYFVQPFIDKITKHKKGIVNVITIIIAILMLIDAIYSFILK